MKQLLGWLDAQYQGDIRHPPTAIRQVNAEWGLGCSRDPYQDDLSFVQVVNILPIVVAHGEGRAEFPDAAALAACSASNLVSLRFVDNHGRATEAYPSNPNGSPQGITGLTSSDGRATILMPHPERVFRTVQNSWHPREWGEDSGWMRMFRNARVWVG